MSIISNLLPLSAQDIVAILDENGEQIFVSADARKSTPFGEDFAFSIGSFLGGRIKAQPTKAFINRDTKGFSHPLENNTSLTDHRIIYPIEITMTLLISKDSKSEIYKQIEDFFLSALTVQVKTKAKTYDDLYISAMPHNETPQKFDTLEMDIKFREIQVASGTVLFAPLDTDQLDTVGRGELNIQVA